MSIDLDRVGATAVVTLNRPEVLNALDAEAYAQLTEVWTEVRDNPAIRSAIVAGAGDRAFCAGADIRTFLDREQDLPALWRTQQGQLLNRGLEVWKPVIAAVNGVCLGGGTTLLLATDLRIAVPDATFGLSEVRRGVIAANGGTQRLVEQLPYTWAMELLLTGQPWTAQKALDRGLIGEIVEPARLMDHALELAGQLNANAPLAVQATKELAVRARDMDRAAALRFELMVLELLRTSEDAAEGIAGFKERRSARFTGR